MLNKHQAPEWYVVRDAPILPENFLEKRRLKTKSKILENR